MNSNFEGQISSSAIINSGCRIVGKNVSIGPNCIIGEEGPVVIENCQLGKNVRLKGGFFKDSVFLDNSSVGSCAHIREGTLMEEFSKAANCVGFKETILFPYVTTGSLINFCDAFISGGTDQINHSEIGSSYIHFNYTLNKDKATASLFGNVDDGVFLDQNPIFLGGQGGAVGPINVAFGSKIAAGSILRKDYLKKDQIISEPHSKEYEKPFILNHVSNKDNVIDKNYKYIGNIAALYAWYIEIRSKYIRNKYDKAVIDGAINLLISSYKKRIDHVNKISDHQNENNFPHVIKVPDNLFKSIYDSGEYLDDIKNIKPEIKDIIKNWLREIIKINKNICRG